MAKAKKSESASTPAAKKGVKGKKPAASAQPSMVDTDLAAQAAARMIANRAKLRSSNLEQSPAQQETSTFKHMKESLNKPAAQAAEDMLKSVPGPHKSTTPFADLKQVTHNQAPAAGGANRIGVPRRTSSG